MSFNRNDHLEEYLATVRREVMMIMMMREEEEVEMIVMMVVTQETEIIPDVAEVEVEVVNVDTVDEDDIDCTYPSLK